MNKTLDIGVRLPALTGTRLMAIALSDSGTAFGPLAGVEPGQLDLAPFRAFARPACRAGAVPGDRAGRLGRGRPARHPEGYAVTACLRSLLLTWMLRGLAASRTGMVRVSTPAA